MKKIAFYFLAMICCCYLFVNCEQEIVFNNKNEEQQNLEKTNVFLQATSLEELRKEVNLHDELKKLDFIFNRSTSYSKGTNKRFSINTQKVIKASFKDFTSYTFEVIDKTDDKTIFEKFSIQNKKDSISYILLKFYKPNKGKLSIKQEKVSLKQLRNNDFNISLYQRIKEPCRNTFGTKSFEIPWCYSCNAPRYNGCDDPNADESYYGYKIYSVAYSIQEGDCQTVPYVYEENGQGFSFGAIYGVSFRLNETIRINTDLNKTLTKNQLDWLDEHYEIATKIDAFLQNNKTQQAKSFANKAIKALMNNEEVDFEEKLIFDQNIYEKLLRAMSPKERKIYDNELNKTQKFLYLKSATQAYIYAETFYEKPVRNRTGDAVKHTLWNALSASRIGVKLTKKLTDAHEDIPYNYPNHHKETEMDNYNNSYGINLGKSKPSRITVLVEVARRHGYLRYLNNLEWSKEDNSWLATNNSQLIPTNQ